MKKSLVDKLAYHNTKIIRKLEDVNIRRLGSETQILRIEYGVPDLRGEREETLTSEVINNVIIKRPFGAPVQMYADYKESIKQVETHSIDLYEILPIEIRILFDGDFNKESVSLKKGDIVVEVLRDEFENKIPFIMQVTKLMGNFHAKHLVGKYYEAALYRGELTESAQEAIDAYLTAN